MNINVNGEKVVISSSQPTISELLTIQKVEMPETVSVQLNGEFVEREQYGSQTIKDGDTIDFLYFMGGGSN